MLEYGLQGKGRVSEAFIAQGLQRLGLDASPRALLLLAAYITLLERWNQTYNLTAVRQPVEMVERHIFDSLAILPWLQGPRILDVGSGAGLPGIPLAILSPDLSFCLLDSNAKRTRFMFQVVAQLQLHNVQIVRCRVEDYCNDAAFNSLLARAFSSLASLVSKAGFLCAPDGQILAMKGGYPEAELRQLGDRFRVVDVLPLTVPGLQAERHLVRLIPAPDTVEKEWSMDSTIDVNHPVGC